MRKKSPPSLRKRRRRFLEMLEPRLVLDATVVFNEIMYNPVGVDESLEWVELYNQMSVDVDISRWQVAGLDFRFPIGTTMPGDGYLVIAKDPTALQQATGLSELAGPYAGQLSNNGESLELRNNSGRIMDTVDYSDGGQWVVAADGSGASLAKWDPDTASEPAANWATSFENGGTPMQRNFVDETLPPEESTLVELLDTWTYDDGDVLPGPDWAAADFDDQSWDSGSAVFFAGQQTAGRRTPITTLFSTGIADDGTRVSPGDPDPHYALTQSPHSTPPPPDIAATTMVNHSAWMVNDAQSQWIGAVGNGVTNVAAGDYTFETTFDLEGWDHLTAEVTIDVAVDNTWADL